MSDELSRGLHGEPGSEHRPPEGWRESPGPEFESASGEVEAIGPPEIESDPPDSGEGDEAEFENGDEGNPVADLPFLPPALSGRR